MAKIQNEKIESKLNSNPIKHTEDINLVKQMVDNMINSLEQNDHVDQRIIRIGLNSIKSVLSS